MPGGVPVPGADPHREGPAAGDPGPGDSQEDNLLELNLVHLVD